MEKARNSNVEILRIVSMLWIVMHHYVVHGVAIPYGASLYASTFVGMWGKLGVVVFVLISGYYMCEMRFTGRRLAKLWGEVVFYSATITFGFLLADRLGILSAKETFGIRIGRTTCVKALFPVGYIQYWFATDYIILMMCSSMLNLILHRANPTSLRNGLLIATLAWSVFAVLVRAEFDFSEMIWFCVLYLWAGYIRLHGKTSGGCARNFKFAGMGMLFMMLIVGAMLFLWHATGKELFLHEATLFSMENSPLTLLCGMELLLGVVKMKPFTSKVINRIGACMFGVYLIHEHNMMRPFLWQHLFALPESARGIGGFLLHNIVSVALVFVICVLIDMIRQNTVERLYLKAVRRAEPVARKLYEKSMSGLVKCFRGAIR